MFKDFENWIEKKISRSKNENKYSWLDVSIYSYVTYYEPLSSKYQP